MSGVGNTPFQESCVSLGHEGIPATHRVRLYDCDDDPCTGHPYCQECADVLAGDYENDVEPGDLAVENERLREMLHAIVSSAYGETTYPGGRTTTEVLASAVYAAGEHLGYERRIGVD